MRRVRHIVILAVLVGFAFLIVRQQTPPAEEVPAIELHRTADARFFEAAKTKVLNVLIIGSDVREGDPKRGRADTLQLLTVNTESGAGTIVGIPRDSYVPIAGRGTNKINAALFFGGPRGTVQTVAKLSGIKIHYYAIVEFSRFRKVVDLLGGVEVKVPYDMNDSASGARFKAGLKRMNGEQALSFARARKSVPGGDFGRSANQGRLLIAALREFQRDAGKPLSVAKYLRVFTSLVESDVKTNELLDLVATGRRLKPDKITSIVLPGRPGSAGGASVVFLTGGANDVFNKIRDDGVL